MSIQYYHTTPQVGVTISVIKQSKYYTKQQQLYDSILLVQRGNEPLKSYYSVCGGKLQLGETIKQAQLRELYEETTLKIDNTNDISNVICTTEYIEYDNIDNNKQKQQQQQNNVIKYHYVLLHSYIIVPYNTTVTAQSDASNILWLPLLQHNNQYKYNNNYIKQYNIDEVDNTEYVTNMILQHIQQQNE